MTLLTYHQLLSNMLVCAGCAVLCCVQFVQGVLDTSNEAIHDSYAALGVDRLLLTMPAVDNPRSIIDAMLQSRLFMVS